ncbi:MAG: DUF4097 domain-containing protein [Deltaproteobacteria bacterium]|nr:DUF4097 domain-containing protein [Deltaproteobacteria bacterium]
MSPRSLLLCVALAGLVPGVAAAAAPSSETTRKVAASPTVEIRVDANTEVRGWDKSEIEVGGTTSPTISTSKDKVVISIDPADADDLVVWVPRNTHVKVKTRTGDIDIAGLTGAATIETTAGDVEVGGDLRTLTVTTVSGNLEIHGVSTELVAATVSGDLDADRVRGRVRIASSSGNIRLTHAAVSRLDVSTTSGDFRLVGKIEGSDKNTIKTISGDVGLRLAPKSPLQASLVTLSGIIDASLGTVTSTDERHATVSIGSGGPRLDVGTMSGDIEIERKR